MRRAAGALAGLVLSLITAAPVAAEPTKANRSDESVSVIVTGLLASPMAKLLSSVTPVLIARRNS